MSWDGSSGYRTYVFEESTRRCAINYKGQGRKEVIYLGPRRQLTSKVHYVTLLSQPFVVDVWYMVAIFW